jgi:hypothetical protein
VIGALKVANDQKSFWRDLDASRPATKVVRTALQDAASVAGLLITTEALVADKPKKETVARLQPARWTTNVRVWAGPTPG